LSLKETIKTHIGARKHVIFSEEEEEEE